MALMRTTKIGKIFLNIIEKAWGGLNDIEDLLNFGQ